MAGMFLVGPLLGAVAVSSLGFVWTYWVIAALFAETIAVCPLVFRRYSARPASEGARALDWASLRGQLGVLLRDAELRQISLLDCAIHAASVYHAFFIVVMFVRPEGLMARRS